MNLSMNDTSSVTSGLLFPLVVALVGGIVLYWSKLVRERRMIRQALVSEINLLLRQASDYREYLALDGHDWFKVGQTLIESPVFVPSEKQVFTAALPYFWLLSKMEMKKLLLFYHHIDACEKLIEILFLRIQKLETAATPLTTKQVALTKGRRDRIVAGLVSAIQTNEYQITKLTDLPDKYELETGKKTAVKLGVLHDSESKPPKNHST